MCIKGKIDNSKHGLRNAICEIFLNCQRTAAVHQRNSIMLKQLYDNSNHEEFWSYLKGTLSILLVKENCPSVEKLLSFIGAFCSLLKPGTNDSEDIEHPLLSEIVSFVLKASEVSEDIIRIRSCQIINVVLDNLAGAEVSVELCEKLEETLLGRLRDPKNIVRQQAVIALHRLQDPTNPDDSIISEFIRLMTSDSFPKVRHLCVEKVGVRKDVVEHILMRIRDQDQHVRLSAYKRLSCFAGFLKIHEKQLVLHSGFLDKSEKITEYMSTTLVSSWLEHYNGNILNFMKSIRLDADEKDIKNTVELFESVLKVIFKNTPILTLTETLTLDENRLVPIDLLNWEMVSYWRIYVEHLSKENILEDELDKVVPELIYFCKYIKRYYSDMPKEVTSEEFLEQQFIMKQLFLITKTFDFGDVTNRKCLNVLVSNILENVVLISDVTQTIVSTLEHSIPNPTQQTLYVSEIISEILYPLNTEEAQNMQEEKDFKISQLKVKLNELKNEQEKAVTTQNFMEAERIKKELSTLNINLTNLINSEREHQTHQIERKTDILTTIKCLDIAAAILSFPKITQFTPSLKNLKEDFIQELLIHDNDSVRVKALKCYGLCCIIDKETAATGIHIFSTPIFAYQNGEECDTQTLLVCIAAVVDILRIYGAQLMAARNSEMLSESMDEQQQAVFSGGTSLTNILQGLVDLMDDDQYDIQEQAGRGLCQLVLSNRIVSPSLISRLVLKWSNPASVSDSECNRLKQIIGFTLQNIPAIDDCTEQLIEAVFLTIKALYFAPRGSPLADVNVENIGKFLLALCKVSPNADYINNKIAATILKEMIQDSESKINGLYAKLLVAVDITGNQTATEDLLNYCDDVRDVIIDKAIVKNIIKFTTRLSAKALDLEQTVKPMSVTKSTQDTIFEENEEQMDDS